MTEIADAADADAADAVGTEALRRGRPGYDQRGILEVAVAAFNEHGYDATSIGMLADRLGLSKSAIYHHVASKEELLRLALDEALDGLEGVLLAPEATTGAAADRLAFVLESAGIHGRTLYALAPLSSRSCETTIAQVAGLPGIGCRALPATIWRIKDISAP